MSEVFVTCDMTLEVLMLQHLSRCTLLAPTGLAKSSHYLTSRRLGVVINVLLTPCRCPDLFKFIKYAVVQLAHCSHRRWHGQRTRIVFPCTHEQLVSAL